MRVLVTGSAGFLGRHLTAALERRGARVVTVPRSIVDLTVAHADLALARLCMEPLDVVFHLATWARPGSLGRERPGDQWLVNASLDQAILSFWARHQPQALFVSCGSKSAYSPNLKLLAETSYTASEPDPNLFGYAWSKRALVIGQQAFCRQLGDRCGGALHLVLPGMFGPDYHLDGRPRHLVIDLAARIALAGSEQRDPTLLGPPDAQREALPVLDAAEWMIDLALLQRSSTEPLTERGLLNLAGHDRRIDEYAAGLCRALDINPAAVTYQNRESEASPRPALDATQLDNLLPGRQQTDTVDALRVTARWVASHLQSLLQPQ